MLRYALFLLAVGFTATACSSLRKLSRVETREPASSHQAATASLLRDRLAAFRAFAPACPAEVRDLLPVLAEERVSFPPCPPGLPLQFEAARSSLNMEERSTIEEILNSHCRSLGREGFDESLDSLLNNFSLVRPLAKRSKTRERLPASTEEQAALLLALREGLEEIRNVHQPLDRWMRNNGEFVIPENELDFYGTLAMKQACQLSNDEIDQSYRTIRGLEELMRIEKESDPQRARIEQFLLGVHKVIDRKIKEFFRP